MHRESPIHSTTNSLLDREPESVDYVYNVEVREGDGCLLGAEDEHYPVMWAKVAAGLLRWATQLNLASFEKMMGGIEAAASLGYSQGGEMARRLLQQVGLSDDVIQFMQASARGIKAGRELPVPATAGRSLNTALSVVSSFLQRVASQELGQP